MESLWPIIRNEVQVRATIEPHLGDFLQDLVLQWRDGCAALSHTLARRLTCPSCSFELLRPLVAKAFREDGAIGEAAAADLRAFVDRDPACREFHLPFLFYKGFHALQIQRVANWYWRSGSCTTAYLIQHRTNEALAIDIHPAVRIGIGVMLDHGTGFVAGETAVIGDDVSLLHGVTLGGTGKQRGDRHPKVRDGAFIGAGAQVLGNIEIGAGAKIGAGSVVLDAVPRGRTVVGLPARSVFRAPPPRVPVRDTAGDEERIDHST